MSRSLLLRCRGGPTAAAGPPGGVGLAASGNLDPSRANPSMFEPVHADPVCSLGRVGKTGGKPP